MNPVRYVAALAVVAGGLFLPTAVAPPAAALSCVGPETVLADADVIVAGHVVDAEDGRILVAVDEVWRGDGVPGQLWLAVDLPGWSAWADPDGEIPDGHSDPRRWVLAPHDGAVNSCTAWRPRGELRREIQRHRPDDPMSPVAGSASAEERPGTGYDVDGGRVVWWPWWVGVGAGVVLVGGAVTAGRRRTH